MTFIVLIVLIASSLFIENQDKPYNEWRAFNKARSSMADNGMINAPKGYFTPVELFCATSGWFQDPQLLPTDKMKATAPTLVDISLSIFPQVNFISFLKTYKYKHWIWLLLATSILVMILNIKIEKVSFFYC